MTRIAAVVSNGCAPDPRVLRDARWLVEAGHEVTIHAFDRDQSLVGEEVVEGVRIVRHRVGKTAYGGTLSTWLGLRRFRRSVLAKMGDVDLIHCHDADTLPLVKRTKTPVMFDMHDLHHTWIRMGHPRSWIRRLISGRMKRTMLNQARSASSVVTSSEGFQVWLDEHGIGATVVENRPESQSNQPLPDRFTVGFLGRVRDATSFSLLIDAIAQIPESDRPFLRIAGDGTAFDEVAELVSRSDLDAEISGSFSAEDLSGLMAEISLMFAMYDPERENIAAGALPVKMFDAANHGRPSIVTAGVPMGDLCEAEGLGQAVPWADPQALIAALMEMQGSAVRLVHGAERERTRFLEAVNQLFNRILIE